MASKKKVTKKTATKRVVVPFAQEVWDTLADTNVADHKGTLPKTKKRPAVDYLPWHKAWMLCKREFPATTYMHDEDLHHSGDTVEVGVVVHIRKTVGGDIVHAFARLAVMDNYFNPIAEPNARQINDTRQRALVKALAFAGLGLNLWSESPLPVGKLDDPISKKQLATLKKLIKDTKTDAEFFAEWCECDLEDLPMERYGSAHGLLKAKLRKMSK